LETESLSAFPLSRSLTSAESPKTILSSSSSSSDLSRSMSIVVIERKFFFRGAPPLQKALRIGTHFLPLFPSLISSLSGIGINIIARRCCSATSPEASHRQFQKGQVFVSAIHDDEYAKRRRSVKTTLSTSLPRLRQIQLPPTRPESPHPNPLRCRASNRLTGSISQFKTCVHMGLGGSTPSRVPGGSR
jgi:hypothetical protein